MIELITKLIDRIIQLNKQRQEQNRSLYNDYVQPLLSVFTEVHNDYVKSFESYRRCIQESRNISNTIKELSEQIDYDILRSATNRSELWSMRSLNEDKILSDLYRSIIGYLDLRRW